MGQRRSVIRTASRSDYHNNSHTPLFYPLGHSGGPREDKGSPRFRNKPKDVPCRSLKSAVGL
jgi:hypothetical protein